MLALNAGTTLATRLLGNHYNRPVSNWLMWIAVWVVVVIMAGACSGRPSTMADSDAYEVDAKGAAAMVEHRWTLRAPAGDPIGVILSIARCGDVLYAGDMNGRILRLNAATGVALSPVNEGALPMALIPACDQGVLYAAGPAPSRKAPTFILTALDLAQGTVRSRTSLPGVFMPTFGGAAVAQGVMVSGLWAAPQEPAASRGAFYADKKIGWLIDEAGAGTPAFAPFVTACRGAGACAGATVAPLDDGGTPAWLVTQPVADSIAVFGPDRQLVRQLSIASPLFRNGGVDLDPATAAEPRLRWMADNSIVNYSAQFGADVIGTVHSVVRFPPGWRFGQFVRSEVFLNLHSRNGRRLVADIGLPEFPVGRDADGLYVVDYGENGRQGSHDEVAILRIPVKVGTEGFRH